MCCDKFGWLLVAMIYIYLFLRDFGISFYLKYSFTKHGTSYSILSIFFSFLCASTLDSLILRDCRYLYVRFLLFVSSLKCQSVQPIC